MSIALYRWRVRGWRRVYRSGGVRVNNINPNTDTLHTHIHELIRQFKTIRAMNEYSTVQVAGKRLEACIQEWRSKSKQH